MPCVAHQDLICKVAALTGRAFRLNWKTHDPNKDVKLALVGPNIDWGYQDSDAISGQTQREDWRQNVAWHPPDARDFQVFGSQDLRLLGNGTRTVVFMVTGGSVNHLFYNPHHRQQVLPATLSSPAYYEVLWQQLLSQTWDRRLRSSEHPGIPALHAWLRGLLPSCLLTARGTCNVIDMALWVDMAPLSCCSCLSGGCGRRRRWGAR